MRVFPLEPRQEKRIILSYTQKLEVLHGLARYHFPAGHSLGRVRSWSFHARVKGGAGWVWRSDSHALGAAPSRGDLLLDAARRNVRLNRDLVLELSAGKSSEALKEAVRFSSAELDGERYLMLRYRPVLAVTPRRRRRDWVVLFETAGERTPLLARTQIEIIRALLANAGPGDKFTVIAAGTRPLPVTSRLLPVTPKNVRTALARLEQIHLIGALSFRDALVAARPFCKAAQNPWLVHVGSGVVGMGERRAHVLARRLPDRARYLGIGVGKRWGQHLMRVLAERSDGYTTQINPNEPIAWRAFDLMAALNAPRLLNVKVVDPAGRAVFLNHANALAQGEELCAVARLGAKDRAWPRSVTVNGRLNGRPFRRALPVTAVVPGAGYLPRTWARLEIDRLLADSPLTNRRRIVALSKAMYVMSPFTSLLVLENDAMYKQFKVDRGRKDHWAMYPCPQKIEGGEPRSTISRGRKPSTEEVLRTILVRRPPRILHWPWQARTQAPGRGETAFDIYAVAPVPTHPESPLDPLGEDLSNQGSLILRQGSGGTLDIQEQVQDRVQDRVPDPDTLRQIRRLQNKLAEAVDTPEMKDKVTLQDALDYLSTRYHLTILIDLQAFRDEARDDEPGEVETTPVHLSPLVQVSLGTVLRLLLSQVPGGADYLLRRDFVEVTTPRIVEAEKRELVHSLLGDFGSVFRGGQFNTPDGLILFDLDLGGGHRWQPGRGWKYSPATTRRLRNGIPSLPALPALSRGRSSGDWVGDLWGDRPGIGRLEELEAEPLSLSHPTGPRTLEEFAETLREENDPPVRALLYGRPTFSGQEGVFRDLTAYAPGLNTTRADIRAVLEAEAEPGPSAKLGRIDPAARALISRSRAAGWQAVSIPAARSRRSTAGPFTVTCDGGGRFVYDRTLATGLRERVVCDGQTLWHLYPDLGLGARRSLSRFHLLDFAALVPWVLAAPGDLARGADLRRVGSRTVAIIPHGPSLVSGPDGKPVAGARVHLIFAADGLLTERRVVHRSGRTLFREQYSGGMVRRFDARGKEIFSRRLVVSPANQPELQPDTKNLVVLPFPLRTREHVVRSHRIKDEKQVAKLPEKPALALLAAYFGGGKENSVRELFRQRFHGRGRRHLGLYTLLAANGINLGPGVPIPHFRRFQARLRRLLAPAALGFGGPLSGLRTTPEEPVEYVLNAHPREPLARYLAVIHNPRLERVISLGGSGNPWHGFLERLLECRALYNRRHLEVSRAEVDAVLRRVRQGARDALAWAELSLLIARRGLDPGDRRAITEAFGLFAEVRGLGYAARYERARGLLLRGRRSEAKAGFLRLYAETLWKGELPRIDFRFPPALQRRGRSRQGQQDGWSELVRETAAGLLRQKRRGAVVTLAWQCWQLGDQPCARRLLGTALKGIAGRPERFRVSLAALEFLWRTHQFARADRLLESLLADRRLAGRSTLWRLGAALSERRRMPARALSRFERALELEARHLPEVIDREAVRSDYGALLAHYRQLTDGYALVEAKPPRALLTKVVWAADRWRALDPGHPIVCPLAAQILYKLRARELAWEYLNTPVAVFPPDAESWLELARALGREGDFDLADRAYRQAFGAEPDNARILWERAQNLERNHRDGDARRVYRRLAQGRWKPRFRWLQEEARRRIGDERKNETVAKKLGCS
jgi:tetratricopeptide (TPR) repeat protein